jgi:hypothetical protein
MADVEMTPSLNLSEADLTKKDTSSTIHHSGYELLSGNQIDHVAKHSQHYAPPDISWVNLNFKAGQKDILKNCWGKVN